MPPAIPDDIPNAAFVLLGISLVIRLGALIWSLVLLRRVRDWRLGVVGLLLASMVFRQALALASLLYDGGKSWPFLTRFGSEFPGIGIGVLTLCMVYFLGRVLDERQAATRRLEHSEERYRKIFEEGPLGVGTSDMDHRITQVNPMFAHMLEYEPAEMVGRDIFDITHADDRGVNRDFLTRLLDGQLPFYSYEKRFLKKSGQALWAHVTVSLVRDEAGRPLYTLAMIEDITGRKQAEARQQLMMNELDHRVKNNLATVVALAEQTIDRSASMGQFRAAFIGRIYAMARAHEALAMCRWQGINLADIAGMILNPHHDNDGRVKLIGPPLSLPAEAALPVSLALHELSTNAVKHGSLSDPAGTVTVAWRQPEEGVLEIVWEESGGPAAAPPQPPGMGHELIEGLIGYQLRGRVDLRFEPHGLRCTMTLPITFTAHPPPLSIPSSAPAAE